LPARAVVASVRLPGASRFGGLRAGGLRLVAAILGAALTPALAAQCPTSFLQTGTTQFGRAFDVSGDLIVLGDGALGFGGTAFVMHRAAWGWKSEASLFSSAPVAGGRFGDAVAIAGDWAAVGAPGELGGAGAVHVFRRVCDAGAPCSWAWTARLTPAQGAAGDRFGAALALDGGRLVVAAPFSDLAAEDAGALFVFDEAGGSWSQTQALTAGAGAAAGDALGGCVALAGSVAVAGSDSANAAWIFEASTGASAGSGAGSGAGPFGPAQRLSLPGAGNFGASVATDGTRILIGAPGSNLTAIKSGAAHVFEPVGAAAPSGGTGWALTATLEPPGYALFASFGSSVALDGAAAAVGATGSNAGRGALHVLRLQPAGWTTIADFDVLPGPESLGLGVAAKLDHDTLLCGARTLFGPPGVVYTFGGVAPWTELGGGLPGSAGLPALAIDGSLCGGDELSFTISHGKAKAAALLVVGLEAALQPWKGGVLWPQPEFVLPATLSAAGEATQTLHLPIGQPGGQPVFAQAWIADPAGPSGLAATPAAMAETP